MRVLLLHPDDVPWRGEWATAAWDLIVDLGFAGSSVYEEWKQRVDVRVISLHQFAGETTSYRWVNQLLAAGRNRLLDRLGLDWWEILACWAYHELQALFLLERLRLELGSGAHELVASREHSHAHLLRAVTGWPIPCFGKKPSFPRTLASRISFAAQNLRPSQMLEIAFDKWDPSYRLRSRFAKHGRARLKEPVVLLPSAYSNVTRVQLAYAAQLPGRRFLLATTRRSGESKDLPPNVDSVGLSAYARDSRDTQLETAKLITAWTMLRKELEQTEELRHGFQANLWDYFPRHLQNGLRLRDAWQFLVSTEPVSGVLCGDDLNYYTRLPLMLAQRLGRTAIYCYHGALDGGLLFKKSYADLHLVKGEMERDYMLRMSAVEPEKIEIAAPAARSTRDLPARPWKEGQAAAALVMFSQPYEISGGRAEEIYRETLSRLSTVAERTNRKIILKLHPFESRRRRERLLRLILPVEQRARVEISHAPVAEIVARAWCGIGIDSSVAAECAQRGIPYFMCGWLDCSGFGYMRQFVRFGAGTVLEAPEEILSIPQRLIEFKPDHSKIRQLWCPADDARLDEILFGCGRVSSSIKCAC